VDRGTGWLGWAWLSTGRLTGLAFMLLGLGSGRSGADGR